MINSFSGGLITTCAESARAESPGRAAIRRKIVDDLYAAVHPGECAGDVPGAAFLAAHRFEVVAELQEAAIRLVWPKRRGALGTCLNCTEMGETLENGGVSAFCALHAPEFRGAMMDLLLHYLRKHAPRSDGAELKKMFSQVLAGMEALGMFLQDACFLSENFVLRVCVPSRVEFSLEFLSGFPRKCNAK